MSEKFRVQVSVNGVVLFERDQEARDVEDARETTKIRVEFEDGWPRSQQTVKVWHQAWWR